MKLTPLIQKALDAAAKLHHGAKRKGSDTPFIVHPVGVAIIVSNYTEDEDVIAAALLHDVLEDVPGYGFDAMKRDFGEKIVLLVKDVSEDKDPNVKFDEKATWEERKKKYLTHLNGASEDALLISAADKIHNLYSLRDTYVKLGKSAFDHFNAPPKKIVWYYQEILKILRERLKSPIVDELEVLFEDIRRDIEMLMFPANVIERYFDDSSLAKGGKPKLVLIMGGTGSGKTTIRKQKYSTDYVLIDAGDIFKVICGGNDINYQFGEDFLEAMEIIGQETANRAINEKRNIVMEIIGDKLETVNMINDSMSACGYEVQLEAVICDPVEAYKRHLKGAYEFLSCYFSEPYHIKWLLAATRVFEP